MKRMMREKKKNDAKQQRKEPSHQHQQQQSSSSSSSVQVRVVPRPQRNSQSFEAEQGQINSNTFGILYDVMVESDEDESDDERSDCNDDVKEFQVPDKEKEFPVQKKISHVPSKKINTKTSSGSQHQGPFDVMAESVKDLIKDLSTQPCPKDTQTIKSSSSRRGSSSAPSSRKPSTRRGNKEAKEDMEQEEKRMSDVNEEKRIGNSVSSSSSLTGSALIMHDPDNRKSNDKDANSDNQDNRSSENDDKDGNHDDNGNISTSSSISVSHDISPEKSSTVNSLPSFVPHTEVLQHDKHHQSELIEKKKTSVDPLSIEESSSSSLQMSSSTEKQENKNKNKEITVSNHPLTRSNSGFTISSLSSLSVSNRSKDRSRQ